MIEELFDKDDGCQPPEIDCEVACLHCGKAHRSKNMVFEKRFYCPYPLWWCPDPTCDGAGYKFDLWPTSEPFGRGILPRAVRFNKKFRQKK